MYTNINPIDLKVLDSLKSLQDAESPDLVRRVITQYLRDTKKRLKELDVAIHQQNFLLVERLAHIIRGSSGTMGAHIMLKVSTDLEDSCQQGLTGNISPLFSELTEIFSATDKALRIECKIEEQDV